MKIWRSLNRNPAKRWCESWALWSSFPVAYVEEIFLGKLLLECPLDKDFFGALASKSVKLLGHDDFLYSCQLNRSNFKIAEVSFIPVCHAVGYEPVSR